MYRHIPNGSTDVLKPESGRRLDMYWIYRARYDHHKLHLHQGSDPKVRSGASVRGVSLMVILKERVTMINKNNKRD